MEAGNYFSYLSATYLDCIYTFLFPFRFKILSTQVVICQSELIDMLIVRRL